MINSLLYIDIYLSHAWLYWCCVNPCPNNILFLNAGAFWVFFILIEWVIFQGASS